MRITIVGAGYVGLSLGALLAQHHEVTLLDQDLACVAAINQRKSPIVNKEIEDFLASRELSLAAVMSVNANLIYPTADCIILAIPTPAQQETPYLNTHDLELAIAAAVKYSRPNTPIVIKSTVPMGFTEQVNMDHSTDRIVFCPEFLTEATPITDHRRPSRIVVGGISDQALHPLALLFTCFCDNPDPPIYQLHSRDAEAIKFFSNAYLAMRVAFFNELDSFGLRASLDVERVIAAMGSDPRIGNTYNIPSFGFRGTCFPKDLHYLTSVLADAESPHTLIGSIAPSNVERIRAVTSDLLGASHRIIGIYRPLSSPTGNQLRASITHALFQSLKAADAHMVIYEPSLHQSLQGGHNYADSRVIHSLDVFASTADVIVADRVTDELRPFAAKIYTRDTTSKN